MGGLCKLQKHCSRATFSFTFVNKETIIFVCYNNRSLGFVPM
nr:MAG TPA: hypothetical protein [Caudoviricetes sp.]